jgi:maleylpyruvate isomerase
LAHANVESVLPDVASAHQRLHEVLLDLTDKQVREPSLLPRWTRGHVLAHLADGARAFARVASHRLRGSLVPMWEPGERDAIIEANASLTALEHRAAVREHSDELERVWSAVTDWSLPVLFRNADLAATVYARWREVCIHLTDLNMGITPADWTPDFACHTIDFLQTRLPQGFSLRATDRPRQWGTGTEIAGEVRDLAAWLTGRVPGPLPELGPWPPHPTNSVRNASTT